MLAIFLLKELRYERRRWLHIQMSCFDDQPNNFDKAVSTTFLSTD